VISFTAEYTHRGSVRNLLGENPDPELLRSLSNETQVTAETPPTFLFHTGEDHGVRVQNSLAFYAALVEHGVPAELHVYQNGPHGVGLAPGDPVLSTWKERLAAWLQVNGFLAATKRAEVSGTVALDGEPFRWGTIAFVPRDAKLPTAFALVANGRYSFSKSSAPAIGRYDVILHDLGGIEPRPTLEDARQVGPPGPAGPASLSVEVKHEANVFHLDLQSRAAPE
jgi:hypothetical protein